MAARSSSSPADLFRFGARAARLASASPGAFLLALAFPILFLHVEYQPGITVGVGSTRVSVELSDLVVMVLGAVALRSAWRGDVSSLRGGRTVWAASVGLVALIVAACFYPLAWRGGYPWLANLVTAVKFAEYALLALAVPLLVRGAREIELLFGAVALWCVAAAGVGVLQFVGLVDQSIGRRPGQREPSFLGFEDFAALAAAGLALTFATTVLGRRAPGERLLGRIAAAGGTVGLVLSGALAGLLGTYLAAAGALVLARRRGLLTRARAATVGGLVVLVSVGYLLMRSGDVGNFLGFLGVKKESRQQEGQVQTYAQRTLLGYIGLRIFADNPVAGIGWQGSKSESGYGPYLPDAHRKFADQPARAFPSPEHPWGVHNAYIQALSDMGVLGLLALLGLLVAGVLTGARVAARAPPELARPALVATLWVLVVAGVSNGRGIVAGLPADALLWLALGLAVATAAWWHAAER